MTSGQWTITAKTKRRVCFPVEISSPSFTSMTFFGLMW